MNIENYPDFLVPLEIAKELKEIDFDEKCLCYWNEDLLRVECLTDKNENLCPQYYDYNENIKNISLPTWEQVLKWFRKRYIQSEIWYNPEHYEGDEKGGITKEYPPYHYGILNGMGEPLNSKSYFWFYEDARQALIKELIKIHKTQLMKLEEEKDKWLVPFYIAEELKNIGFDMPTMFCYEIDKKGKVKYKQLFKWYQDEIVGWKEINNNVRENTYSAPTYEQVFEWFKEKGYINSLTLVSSAPNHKDKTYLYQYTYTICIEKENNKELKGSICSDFSGVKKELINILINLYKNK